MLMALKRQNSQNTAAATFAVLRKEGSGLERSSHAHWAQMKINADAVFMLRAANTGRTTEKYARISV